MLRYILKKIEDRQLLFQVLEMDEELRDKGLLFKFKGIEICSIAYPYIYNNIYLRGTDKEKDYDAVIKSYEDTVERDNYYILYKDALEAFSIHLNKKAKQIIITQDILVDAFTEWDKRYREDSRQFMNEAERFLKETPHTIGQRAASYLLKIIAEQRKNKGVI